MQEGSGLLGMASDGVIKSQILDWWVTGFDSGTESKELWGLSVWTDTQ